ncbi:MAG: restriction endonuclease subunit S [Campylobacter sp.]
MSEFKNLPSGWKVVRLGEIGKILNGLTYSPENVSNNGLLVLRSSNINDNFIVLNNDDVYVKGISKFNKTLENDILICVRNGSKNLIGKNALITEKYKDLAFGAFMAIFRSNYNLFLIHIFKTNTFFKQVKNDLGATINSINNSNLLNFKIPLPPIDEQEKIAEILSTWDEAINLTINLIENKKQFKKALMQNLLTAKIRFPEFQDEWEETKLEKIFTEYTLLNDDKLKQYTIGKNGIKEIDDCNYEVDKHKIFMKNDFIVGIGIYEMNVNINLDKGSCSPIYHVYSTNENLVVPKFIYYYVRRAVEKIKPFITKKSTRREYEFNAKEFIKHKILAPSLKEQEKIAEVLTACDDEINLLNLKLENLKKQKQGLMQKLLSGKVRI